MLPLYICAFSYAPPSQNRKRLDAPGFYPACRKTASVYPPFSADQNIPRSQDSSYFRMPSAGCISAPFRLDETSFKAVFHADTTARSLLFHTFSEYVPPSLSTVWMDFTPSRNPSSYSDFVPSTFTDERGMF